MAIIYLSVGSNISPESNFQKCFDHIQLEFSNVVWSPIYRTKPIGMSGPDFLNAVVRAETSLNVVQVINILKSLEQKHGRVKQENAFSDRTLDLDLLLYGNECIDTPNLTIPSDELCTMGFILRPMADIAGHAIHPLLNQTYNSLLLNLTQSNPQQFTGMEKTDLSF